MIVCVCACSSISVCLYILYYQPLLAACSRQHRPYKWTSFWKWLICFYLCVTFVPLWQKTESWPVSHSGASLEHCTGSEYVYMHTNILVFIILSRIWWLYGTGMFISQHMILTPSMFLILQVDVALSSTPPHPSNLCYICTDSAAWSSITEDKSSNQTHPLHHQCWTFTLAWWPSLYC